MTTNDTKQTKAWRVRFSGRHVGAIGVVQRFEIMVHAIDEAAARLAVYEAGYEHVHVIACQEITP